MSISWTPAQQPSGITIVSWSVLRARTSGGPYTQIGSVPVATTTYTDSSVSSGQDYFYVVQAVDSAGVASADCPQVEAVIPTSVPPLSVSTSSLPSGTVATNYSTTLSASGGTAPYSWTGTGADSLTFSATGLLSGTPTQTGTFTQLVTVKDSAGATASASLSLSVAAESAGGGAELVQYATLDASGTSATLAFNSNNTVGNWIIVVIIAGTQNEALAVSDSNRNTYHEDTQYNQNGDTVAIFYAEDIAGGANTITVSDANSATLLLAILEYSGIATSNSGSGTAAAGGLPRISQ